MTDKELINRLVEKYSVDKEIVSKIYYDIYHNMSHILTTEERRRIIEEIKKILESCYMNYFFELDGNGEITRFFPNGISLNKDYRDIFERDTLSSISILETPVYRGEYTIKPNDITPEEYEYLSGNNFDKSVLQSLLITKTLKLFNITNLDEIDEERLFTYEELIESQTTYLLTCQLMQEQIVENRLWNAISNLEEFKKKCAPNDIIDKVINELKKNKNNIRLYLPLRKEKILENLPKYSRITLNRCLFHDLNTFIYELKRIYQNNELIRKKYQ